MIQQIRPIVVDDNYYYAINQAARYREIALEHLESFSTKLNAQGRSFEGDKYLTVMFDRENGYVDLAYAGIRLRFLLVVGMADHEVVIKVKCLQKQQIDDEVRLSPLGEFIVGEGGRTNMIERGGRPFFMNQQPDIISSYYLSIALGRALNAEVLSE